MVNISTDIWEMEMSETGELKQTLNECCLKSRLGARSNSWWSNWYEILKQILFKKGTLLNLEVMNAACFKIDLHNILPLLKVFSKNYAYIIENLYIYYIGFISH